MRLQDLLTLSHMPTHQIPGQCPSPTPEDLQDEQIAATYAGAKRRIAALEQQLRTLQEGGPKRKSYVSSFFCNACVSIA